MALVEYEFEGTFKPALLQEELIAAIPELLIEDPNAPPALPPGTKKADFEFEFEPTKVKLRVQDTIAENRIVQVINQHNPNNPSANETRKIRIENAKAEIRAEFSQLSSDALDYLLREGIGS